jgi:hypothetical protein
MVIDIDSKRKPTNSNVEGVERGKRETFDEG